jgi:hypothetical protein
MLRRKAGKVQKTRQTNKKTNEDNYSFTKCSVVVTTTLGLGV